MSETLTDNITDLLRRLEEADHQCERAAAAERQLCEANAVCLCGCPNEAHEHLGEDGEACEDGTHECIRASRAAYAVVYALRTRLLAAQSTLQQAERDIVALHALLRAHEDDKVRLRYAVVHALRTRLREAEVNTKEAR